MEKIRKLIRESFPGYAIKSIEMYYRPGKGWQSKINSRTLSSYPTSYIYYKIKELNASRISIRITNRKTGHTRTPEVFILTSEPTL